MPFFSKVQGWSKFKYQILKLSDFVAFFGGVGGGSFKKIQSVHPLLHIMLTFIYAGFSAHFNIDD